ASAAAEREELQRSQNATRSEASELDAARAELRRLKSQVARKATHEVPPAPEALDADDGEERAAAEDALREPARKVARGLRPPRGTSTSGPPRPPPSARGPRGPTVRRCPPRPPRRRPSRRAATRPGLTHSAPRTWTRSKRSPRPVPARR
ncbi:unnamed protein product, partial [Prorocentrum cordatum]